MNKNILIIDDDPLVIKTIRKLLEREGYFVEIAKSASEGQEKIKDGNFQLIICDIRMPQTSGIELIRQFKKNQKEEDKVEIPVIFITGYASDAAPEEARELGAKDYILKPFDIDKLLTSIKKYLT